MFVHIGFVLALATIMVVVIASFASNVEARHRKKSKHQSEENAGDENGGKSSWDYLMFVQRWAPSVCNALPTEGCSIPTSIHDWSIHGLWPNNNDGSHPENCDSRDSFDVSKLKPYRAQLEQGWPGLEQGRGKSLESFWAHEWEKHGTCAKSLPALEDEQKYFSESLTLQKTFRIADALRAKNIVPSNTRSYSKAQIQQALRDGLGQGKSDVVVVCRRGRLPGKKPESYAAAVSGAGKVAQFVEARICVDEKFTIRPCPESGRSDNGGDFNACPKTDIYLPNFNK